MEVCNAMVDCCSEKKVLIEYETIFFGDLFVGFLFVVYYNKGCIDLTLQLPCVTKAKADHCITLSQKYQADKR